MIFNLSTENDYKIKKPQINYYLNKIKKNEHFFFAKINHAFWQMLNGEEPWKSMYENLHDKNLIDEVLSILNNINKTDIMLAVSHIGPPQLPNLFPATPIIKQIKKTLPKNYMPYHAAIWKEAEIDNSIIPFYEFLSTKRTIIVGLSHLKKINIILIILI